MKKEKIVIKALSSSGDFYEIIFNGKSIKCSCHAGQNFTLCKHVRAVLNGDESILYDTNDKEKMLKIIESSQIKIEKLEELKKTESEFEKINKEYKTLLKTLKYEVLVVY